jgi:hypothetical protein
LRSSSSSSGGLFSGVNSISGQTRDFIARLEAAGGADQTLNAGIVGGYVLTTAVVQTDGKIPHLSRHNYELRLKTESVTSADTSTIFGAAGEAAG